MKPSIVNLFKLVKTEKLVFALGFLCQLLGKGIEAWLPLAIGFMIAPLSKGNISHAQINSSLNGGFFLLIPLFVWLILEISSSYLRNIFAFRIDQRLRKEGFTRLMDLPITYFDQAKGGEIATYLSDDIEKVREMLADSLLPLIGNLVLLVAVCILSFQLDATWRAIFFLFIPLTIGLFLIFRKMQKEAFDTYREKVLEQNRFLQEHLSGRPLFDLYEPPEVERGQFNQKIDKVQKAIYHVVRSFSLFGSGIDILMGSVWIFATLAFTWLGGGAGNFVTFSLWGTILFRPLIELTDRFNTLISGLASLKKIDKILAVAKEVDEGNLSLTKIEEISFQNVSFSYPLGQPVLKNISFTLKGKVGIVGFTGAGKTTLLSLLLRYHLPTEGQILINGIDHTSFKLDELRKALFTQIQDPVILPTTLEENLSLYTEQQFKTETPLRELSEGGKQLLALERALLANPSGLLLDEATSSIDMATEKEIEDKILTLLKDRLAIVVAHRLSTLRSLDQILLLDNGQILEEGTFDQLLEKKGLFYQLWSLLALEENREEKS